MSVRIGIMGFGNIGRQLYRIAQNSGNIEIPVISDIGNPEILHYLLVSETETSKDVQFQGNYLINDSFKTRMFQGLSPGDVPWDVFDVDIVVDATGKFSNSESMKRHLNSGVKKVIISTLPEDDIDRIIIPGVNEYEIHKDDKTISAGSSTMNALALILKSLDSYKINAVNMTTIHSYTSDQPLQDVAGSDFRRSRSAAENIIPNISRTENWIPKIFPQFEGIISCNALNVPVQKGSLLDLSISFSEDIRIEDINNNIKKFAAENPSLINTTTDPIVSSDIIGSSQSITLDELATMKAGDNLVKILGWYDNGYCHAWRIMDVIKSYSSFSGVEA